MELLITLMPLACSGLCCLLIVVGVVAVAVWFMRRGSAGDAPAAAAKALSVEDDPTDADGPKPDAAPAKNLATPPSTPKPAASKTADPFDDDDMATIVAPPPAGLGDIPMAPPPPPPSEKKPAAPPADDKKPDAAPSRSAGQTIIAFEDDFDE